MDEVKDFTRTVREYYRRYGRHDLPWRKPVGGTLDPYMILVSEVMLQQTQVARVIPKYEEFLRVFPSLHDLAVAHLGDVLTAWQGLGYNRRAKFLWQAAQDIEHTFAGALPRSQTALATLPGVGKNTAGAIMAYAFNEPAVFIETNIRSVYIYHFFRNQTDVPDAAIAELVRRTLDRRNPRLWYWALMDYGAFLKQRVGNVSRASKAFTRQSRFEGSVRQLRGRALKLLASGPQERKALVGKLADQRAGAVLAALTSEGLIRLRGRDRYELP